MLHSLNNNIAATKTVTGTISTLDAVPFFPDCASWNPNASILLRASDTILQIDSDGTHLVAPKARIEPGDSIACPKIKALLWLIFLCFPQMQKNDGGGR